MLYLLEKDLEIMGFPRHWMDEDQNTYDRFWSILQSTADASNARLDDIRSDDLVTDFGKRLFHLAANGAGFTADSLPCCQNTEPFLRKSLLGTKDKTGEKRGPLLLISDGPELVAVQKNTGDPSVYPIAERPEAGLFVGTIAAPIRHVRPGIIDACAEQTVVIPMKQYQGFVPKRMTSTAIDGYIRHNLAKNLSDLRSFTRKGILISYSQVVAASLEKVQHAIPFDTSMLLTEPFTSR